MLGQSTFNVKCGKCHGLKVTTDYTADRWVSIMQVMATKAQLTETEKENSGGAKQNDSSDDE